MWSLSRMLLGMPRMLLWVLARMLLRMLVLLVFFRMLSVVSSGRFLVIFSWWMLITELAIYVRFFELPFRNRIHMVMMTVFSSLYNCCIAVLSIDVMFPVWSNLAKQRFLAGFLTIYWRCFWISLFQSSIDMCVVSIRRGFFLIAATFWSNRIVIVCRRSFVINRFNSWLLNPVFAFSNRSRFL